MLWWKTKILINIKLEKNETKNGISEKTKFTKRTIKNLKIKNISTITSSLKY